MSDNSSSNTSAPIPNYQFINTYVPPGSTLPSSLSGGYNINNVYNINANTVTISTGAPFSTTPSKLVGNKETTELKSNDTVNTSNVTTMNTDTPSPITHTQATATSGKTVPKSLQTEEEFYNTSGQLFATRSPVSVQHTKTTTPAPSPTPTPTTTPAPAPTPTTTPAPAPGRGQNKIGSSPLSNKTTPPGPKNTNITPENRKPSTATLDFKQALTNANTTTTSGGNGVYAVTSGGIISQNTNRNLRQKVKTFMYGSENVETPEASRMVPNPNSGITSSVPPENNKNINPSVLHHPSTATITTANKFGILTNDEETKQDQDSETMPSARINGQGNKNVRLTTTTSGMPAQSSIGGMISTGHSDSTLNNRKPDSSLIPSSSTNSHTLLVDYGTGGVWGDLVENASKPNNGQNVPNESTTSLIVHEPNNGQRIPIESTTVVPSNTTTNQMTTNTTNSSSLEQLRSTVATNNEFIPQTIPTKP